jgi:hypothetical protein
VQQAEAPLDPGEPVIELAYAFSSYSAFRKPEPTPSTNRPPLT